MFADHLKEGANEFDQGGYHGALRPFDPAVKVETEDTAEGLLVKISEYKKKIYVVGLTNRFLNDEHEDRMYVCPFVLHGRKIIGYPIDSQERELLCLGKIAIPFYQQ